MQTGYLVTTVSKMPGSRGNRRQTYDLYQSNFESDYSKETSEPVTFVLVRGAKVGEATNGDRKVITEDREYTLAEAIAVGIAVITTA